MKKKIGCLGPEASNSYEVAKAINYAGDELIPLSSFELIKSLKSGEIQKAILPIENSIEGRVKWVFDFLAGNNLGLLSIIGEDIWKVRHCLIGFGKESEIKMVYSHPQALGQCRISMGSLDLKDADSTSAAVKFIAESQQKTLAAIGTRQAAERYKVPIIKEDIGDNPENQTRFITIGKNIMQPTSNDKTSLIFGVKDETGALYRVLEVFDVLHINMTMINSEPSPSRKLGEYIFFVDVANHPRLDTALDLIRERTSSLNVLGTYPKATIPVNAN